MINKEITFESCDITLSGSLLIPNTTTEKNIIVVMLPGSGRVDRNENHLHLKTDIFLQIAEYLSEAGINTFRYDKRGIGGSTGDYWSAGLTDNISDANAAIEFVKNTEDIAQCEVYLLGHSEGALIASHIAAQRDDLAGVILLSGAARSGLKILKWQLNAVSNGLKSWQRRLIKLFRIDLMKSQQKMINRINSSTKDVLRVKLFSKVNAKWMREFIHFHPEDSIKKINVPTLAVTGSKDLQVPPEDCSNISKMVLGPSEAHIIEDLTHILRRDPGKPSISNYRKQVKNKIDTEVLNLISDWLVNTNSGKYEA